MILKELSFTEEQFKSWPKAKQRQWLKDHPDSKFGQTSSTPQVTKVEQKKLTPEERKKQAELRLKEILRNKTPKDQKAFMQARKAGVAIPPAWTNIKYYPKPINGVLAEGTDAKGRRQRVEDASYRQGKIQEKHEKIQSELEPKFNRIVSKLKRDLDAPESQVLYLITQTAFRIGDRPDSKTEHTAYGATSLLGKHVKVDGDTTTFDFIGKEGVRQHHVVKDPLIAKYVQGKKPDERLFPVSVEKVRNKWKELGGDKVHDIRSLIATRIAKRIVDKSPTPTTRKELIELQKKAADLASKKLGNRPSEALNTYIDKRIFPDLEESTT